MTPKKPRLRKAPLSKREQLEHGKKGQELSGKTGRVRKFARRVKKPIRGVKTAATEEFFLPLPSGRIGDFLNKKRSLMPRYVIGSWRELKQVTWPTRRETVRLTMAVIIFSLLFGAVTAVVDKGIESIIKDLILK